MNPSALLGYTGFVGSNLILQHHFDEVFNSSNIDDIADKSYELVVCAAARAEKWRANREPNEDLDNIKTLMGNLRKIKTTEFILISTVDVYPNPIEVYEDTKVAIDQASPYGKHRFILEEFVRTSFEKHLIIRLPGLIGKGLKKNFIYDMLHKQEVLHLTHVDSHYQFYSLEYLWSDIEIARLKHLNTINFATPPLSIDTIALNGFGRKWDSSSTTAPVQYDMRTRYANIFGATGNYMCSEEREIQMIQAFIEKERES